MKIKDAVKILKRHNGWRRGEIEEQTDPVILGAAIDTIIVYFGKHEDQSKTL